LSIFCRKKFIAPRIALNNYRGLLGGLLGGEFSYLLDSIQLAKRSQLFGKLNHLRTEFG
jgi:hypothetical protein